MDFGKELNRQIMFAPDSSDVLEDTLGSNYMGDLVDLFADDVAFIPNMKEEDIPQEPKPKIGNPIGKPKTGGMLRNRIGQTGKTRVTPDGPTFGSQYHEGEQHILDEFFGSSQRMKEFMDMRKQLRASGYPKKYLPILAMAKLGGSEEQSNIVITDDDGLMEILDAHGIEYKSTKQFTREMHDSGLLNKRNLRLTLDSNIKITDSDIIALTDPSLDKYVESTIRAIKDEKRRIAYKRNAMASLIGVQKAQQLSVDDIDKLTQVIMEDTEGENNIGLGLGKKTKSDPKQKIGFGSKQVKINDDDDEYRSDDDDGGQEQGQQKSLDIQHDIDDQDDIDLEIEKDDTLFDDDDAPSGKMGTSMMDFF